MAERPTVEFWKLSGSGNDFICIDNTGGCFDGLLNDTEAAQRFARTCCARGHGIGADGLIFSSPPEIEEVADVAARFFEADGSECELCGNGTGCCVRFVVETGLAPDRELRILTPAGVVRGQQVDWPFVKVCIPSPEDRRTNLDVPVDGDVLRCDYALAGVPHLVTWVDDIDAVDVQTVGRALRHHPDFAPRGVNANFVQVINPGEIFVRTYEYGVEDETLACGTGSSVSAIMTCLREAWPQAFTQCRQPIRVRARSGETLRVYFDLAADGTIRDVCLETAVRQVARGCLAPEFLAEALVLPEPA
jgi:diaminopimelate epimerase